MHYTEEKEFQTTEETPKMRNCQVSERPEGTFKSISTHRSVFEISKTKINFPMEVLKQTLTFDSHFKKQTLTLLTLLLCLGQV